MAKRKSAYRIGARHGVISFTRGHHGQLGTGSARSVASGRLASSLAIVALMVVGGCQSEPRDRADSSDPQQVAMGRAVYAQHCASCHGAKLEGQPHWRERKPDGRLPAPPHDVTGHTWEHSDEALFRVTKQGFQAFAGPDYHTDMPAFGGVLTDEEIWAVVAFIESTWPAELQERRKARR